MLHIMLSSPMVGCCNPYNFIRPQTSKLHAMRYKILLLYLMSWFVLEVQCEEYTVKQPVIYDENGLAKVNFFTKKEWSTVGCMKHCQKIGGRSPPVRTLTELNEMKGMLKDLRAFSPSPHKLFLSVTREVVSNPDETLKLKQWPKAQDDSWKDYYTGEMLENYNETWTCLLYTSPSPRDS